MTDEKAMEAAAKAAAHYNSDYEGPELQWGCYLDDMRVGIAAYLAQREADGFVMVPVDIVEDLCSELEAEVQDRWGHDQRLARQLDRDMATVNKARAMIAARPKGVSDT